MDQCLLPDACLLDNRLSAVLGFLTVGLLRATSVLPNYHETSPVPAAAAKQFLACLFQQQSCYLLGRPQRERQTPAGVTAPNLSRPSLTKLLWHLSGALLGHVLKR